MALPKLRFLLIGNDGALAVEGGNYDTAYFDKGPKFLSTSNCHLNNIEFDHAIYDSLDEIIENFDRLMDIMEPVGTTTANADDPWSSMRVVFETCCHIQL